MVMLHADLQRRGARQRVARRQIVGVQIVRDDSRLDAQETRQPLRGRDVRVVGGDVLEIADVRSGIGAVAEADADRVLQQRAAASTGCANGGDADRPRHVTSRPAQAATGAPAITRVTESSQNASMSRSCSRKIVGHRRQARDGVVVAIGERLVADVARRHHERPADAAQQQVMQRRVGKHQADQRRVRRHQARQRRMRTRPRQHDRPGHRRSAAIAPRPSGWRSRSAARRSATITANGFSSRRFSSRRRATVSSSVASQAR